MQLRHQSRKVVGYSDLAKLALAVEADLAAQRAPLHATNEENTRIPTTV